METMKDTITDGKNVFSGKPAHGEVIGKLTKEELAQYFDLSDELYAWSVAGPHEKDTVYKVMELKKEIRMFWQDFCRKNGIKMVWDFGIDEANGYIYMINKE